MALGKEPNYHSPFCVGTVISTNYGYSIQKHILYGYLPLELTEVGTQLEIEYFGKRQVAPVQAEPLFDAQMEKIRR